MNTLAKRRRSTIRNAILRRRTAHADKRKRIRWRSGHQHLIDPWIVPAFVRFRTISRSEERGKP